MKTKLYLLTGFLGSGKTTFLLNILKELKDKRIGIIQNEFGKLGIDGEILKNDDVQMVEINRGSIFCSCLKLNFVKALAEMSENNFEYMFVESSGLGDPSNIDEILEAVKRISGDKYELKGAICLVDAVNFLSQIDDLETVNRQLKHCNISIITKSDIADDETVKAVEEKIKEINPICRILKSINGKTDYGFMEEDLMKYKYSESEETTNTVENKPRTFFMNFDGEVERGDFEEFIKEISDDTYRIKGFFNIKNEGWKQIDVVGRRMDYSECEKKEMSQLVFISKTGTAIIKRIFSAWEENTGLEMKLKN